MTTISATTILRSRNAAAPEKVLSTLLLKYPRWIHAEQRTHRVIPLDEGLTFDEPTPSLMADPNLSRNAASSRAIPLEKQIAAMLADPAVPLWWGAEQKGMQAAAEMPESAINIAKGIWELSMNSAIHHARMLARMGAHKQIVNRVIEPYTHIMVLVSATEWHNFLELRDHEAAEPHIAILAREIRKCLDDESTVQTLQPGEWHLPFIDKAAHDQVYDATHLTITDDDFWPHLIALSVGRCASTSYKTVDGFDMTLDRAKALHDQFVHSRPQHASPLEHVAQADEIDVVMQRMYDTPQWMHPKQHANFVGFRQYRHTVSA